MHDVFKPSWLALLVSLAMSLACDANLGSVSTSEGRTEAEETSSRSD